MTYTIDAYSDIGIRKKVNQDALIIKQARTSNLGRVCFACLCDGMGGLSQGEIASANFVNRMGNWFQNEFPRLITAGDVTEDLFHRKKEASSADYWQQIKADWNSIAKQMNKALTNYGYQNGIRLGTTAVAIILVENQYMVMSVGDSRAYLIHKKKLQQITHDQSYVQQQMDLGRMTPEEAALSPQKSVLLQCIGASEDVVPDFYRGTFEKKSSFLLCSDGLWRLLKPEEIISIAPKQDGVKQLTDIALSRGETDNISGLVIGAK